MKNSEIQKAIRILKQCIKTYDDLAEYYTNKTVSDLKDSYGSIVARWYASIYLDSRDPHIYQRQRSLYKAYKIQSNGTNITVEYNSKYMDEYEHRVSNDYIFENSFVSGFHGGADKGPGHPEPGRPYWKVWGNYSVWGRPATRSKSPYEQMEQAYGKTMTHTRKLFGNAIKNKILQPLQSVINELER